MNVSEFLKRAAGELSEARIESAHLEAQMIAAKVLNIERSKLLLRMDDELDAAEAVKMIERRKSGEPLAYILGEKEFFGRTFFVNPAVLIPRPETEILVSAALGIAQDQQTTLDVGTGSGAIAITLALEKPSLRCIGCDISSAALSVAAKNAQTLGADVRFVRADKLQPIQTNSVDLVVCNPPYVDDQDEMLDSAVRFWEPRIGLFSAGGTAFIQALIGQAQQVLVP